MKDLASLKVEIDKCVRCGACRSVCPVFRVTGREAGSARGKLALAGAYLKGDIPLSEAYARHMKECTLCGSCRDNCPKGVSTTAVFAAARADMVEKQGLPFAASVVLKNMLDSSRLMPRALRLASRLQGLFLKDSSVESGLVSRFSLPVVGQGRLLPPLAKTFFLDMPETRALSGGARTSGARARVAFYAGCGVNYLMPGVGKATLDVLRRAGVEVMVPEGQACCGMPAYSMGDIETARGLALRNIEAFEGCGADFITTSCATCGYGLKTLFADVLSGVPEAEAPLRAFTSKVRDITELLVDELGFQGAARARPGPDRDKVVTYHDPCHLGRAQGLREEPRELLANAEGVVLKEMKNPCACCGLGGGLSLSNYELSMSIAKRKAVNVRDSGADIVATACPGCMVQLRDALHRFGVKATVAHVVELI
jgi:glycolate oxidase iron-sulfur subunit